jgi:regulator of protease activity HflC (stomatin/prohibitin superfamily)
VILFNGGHRKRSGRGLSFWFHPLSASIAEVPCVDRELTFLFHGRSADFQDVVAQGVIAYRVADPDRLSERIDFSVDLRLGMWQENPLDQLTQLLTQTAQQEAWDYLASTALRSILEDGVERIRERIEEGLAATGEADALGLEIVAVRVSSVAPSAELEKALQMPMRESIQQEADEATFARRALAVEKERAIEENELSNRIELARRQEELIAQEGSNQRHLSTEQAEARRIDAQSSAECVRVEAGAEAERIALVEEAQVGSERERVGIYSDLEPVVLFGLAAREFAGKLDRIDHLNLGSDALGPILGDLFQAGARYLTGQGAAPDNGIGTEGQEN